ncbi:hypothetical protein MC885_014583 [Smutsia gigantea]|nr:hypothetical protein MC885_014583 [Smutsia gigantea]
MEQLGEGERPGGVARPPWRRLRLALGDKGLRQWGGSLWQEDTPVRRAAGGAQRHPSPQAPSLRLAAPPPHTPGKPIVLSGGCCRRGGFRLAGRPPKGHNGPEPLPQPSATCPVAPEPPVTLSLALAHVFSRPHLACCQGPRTVVSSGPDCASAALGPSSSTVLDGLTVKLLTLSGKDGLWVGALGSDLQGALKTMEAPDQRPLTFTPPMGVNPWGKGNNGEETKWLPLERQVWDKHAPQAPAFSRFGTLGRPEK